MQLLRIYLLNMYVYSGIGASKAACTCDVKWLHAATCHCNLHLCNNNLFHNSMYVWHCMDA